MIFEEKLKIWENLWMKGTRPEVVADDVHIFFDSDEFRERCKWSQFNTMIYEKMKKWDSSMSKGFYIYGDTGIGKTTFIKTKAMTLAAENPKSKDHVKVVHFGRTIKAMMANKFERYNEILDSMLIAKHLFIDDIGAEFETFYKESELSDILDHRLLHRKDLRTYFTSNVAPDQLAYSPRIERRINDIALPISVNW